MGFDRLRFHESYISSSRVSLIRKKSQKYFRPL
jgi:hypothetical protein